MERLGFCGFLKLTMRILLTKPQHSLCIALLYALPNALTFIGLGPFEQLLQNSLASISLFYKFSFCHASTSNPSHFLPSEEAFVANQEQLPPSLSLLLFVSTLSASISLVCIILVTFSECRACLYKSVDQQGSLCGVPEPGRNLALTGLLVCGVVGFTFGLLGTVIIAAGLSAVNANVGLPITIMAKGVVLRGVLYMAIAFSLMTTVALLEEDEGREAISKSTHLIKGSRWIVVGLYGLYGVMSMVTLCLSTSEEEASVAWRWVAAGVTMGLQVFIVVCITPSTVVLYNSCKSGQGGSVDQTLLAASSQCGLPNKTPNHLDLETAAIAIIAH